MTQLVSRLLLAILLFPVAGVVGLLIVMGISPQGPTAVSCILAAVLGNVCTIAYWLLLWRGVVRWTKQRKSKTWLSVPLAAGIGACCIGLVVQLAGSSGVGVEYLLGGVAAAVSWLLFTVLIWRETAAERVERLKQASASTLSCPTCGYNMTGLHEARCPECGSKFTLDELVSCQPHRDVGKLE